MKFYERILAGIGILAVLGAVAMLWSLQPRADGGPAAYRWVQQCNSAYGPTDAAAPVILTYDQRGNLCVVVAAGGGGGGSGFTPTPVAPTVSASNAVTSLVLKNAPTAGAGGVTRFHAENATTSGGYCVLYNATAAPAPGALAANLVLDFQLLPGSGYCDVDHTMQPVSASVGAVVLITSATTPFTYTTGVVTAAISGVAQ